MPGLLRDTLVMVLAGGEGERLYPLTKDRAKPAVPFGGCYRLIDFTLTNCLHSGLRRIYVLTQYKSDSLNRHVRQAWDVFDPGIGEYIEIRPPQKRMSSDWYLGTAHAIYENIYTLEQERPQDVLVVPGDHVCRLNYADMVASHRRRGAAATVACIERPVSEASERLGVVVADDKMHLLELKEKPAEPQSLPERPDTCLCSMGIYVFDTEVLVRRVIQNLKEDGGHDFAQDVLPRMIAEGRPVYAHLYRDCYWRDIGTLDCYWTANMDLVQVRPEFNLYDADWPIRGCAHSLPPAKLVFGGGGDTPRAEVYNSLVSGGAIISGAYVCDSVIGPRVQVEVGSRVERSIILDDVRLGRNVTLRKALVDKHNTIPDGASIGVDRERDAARFTVSPGGVVAVPKGMPFPACG